MRYSRELINGFIIFALIAVYFLILEALGFSDVFILRIVNMAFVAYGIHRTIKGNYESGVRGYNKHFLSAIITSMFGAVLSIVGLMIYIEIRGGEAYLETLAYSFLFGGGRATIPQYCFGLFIESSAASFIGSFVMMQYWKDKIEVINQVD